MNWVYSVWRCYKDRLAVGEHLVQNTKWGYEDSLTTPRHLDDFLERMRVRGRPCGRKSESSQFYFFDEEGEQLSRGRKKKENNFFEVLLL